MASKLIQACLDLFLVFPTVSNLDFWKFANILLTLTFAVIVSDTRDSLAQGLTWAVWQCYSLGLMWAVWQCYSQGLMWAVWIKSVAVLKDLN